jgi:hypothetical protein
MSTTQSSQARTRQAQNLTFKVVVGTIIGSAVGAFWLGFKTILRCVVFTKIGRLGMSDFAPPRN